MGAFFLARRQPGQGEEKKNAASNALAQQGFAQIKDLSNAQFDVLYGRKFNLDSDNLYRQDPDNFCICSGTLIYRNQIGAGAARTLFEDFRRHSLDAGELFGNFALVLCVDGVPHIHNDAQGVYPIWHDAQRNCFSSSFHALLSQQPRLTLNRAAVYPYVFQEASFGGDTVFQEVQRLKVKSAYRLGSDSRAIPPLGQAAGTPPPPSDLQAQVSDLHQRLSAQFQAITECFDSNIDSALSGGYDSRLLLALCREQGITPHLHVYGKAEAADVQVAKRICEGEGIALSHEDKSALHRVSPEQFVEIVRGNYQAFQGPCADGILDNGADLQTRRSRSQGGRLLLNGGGGEVMRNFFYLPDRRYTPRQVLWAFFSQFDPAVCSEAFSADEYYRHFEQQIAELTGSDGRLDRSAVEYLYAGFRCTYWMGQNNAINNQFGWFLTPFVEDNIARHTHAIPLRLKNHGRLQAALINQVSPSLAAYPSDYGHNFADGIPLKRRLKDYATLLRPTWLRRYTYRLKKRTREDWPYYLQEPYLRQLLPEGFTYLSRYFDIDKVCDAGQFKRICTLEYLLQATGADD